MVILGITFIARMKMRPCNTHLNWPGRIISLLVGHCGLWMPTAVAFPRAASVRSIRTDIARPQLWPAAKGASNRLMLTTAWQSMLSKQCGDVVSLQEGVGATSASAALPTSTLEIRVTSPREMEETGAFFGEDSGGADVVLLHGDLGTGKTCFARGFVRARVGDPDLAVTSPSYLLDNTYKVEGEELTLHHMDLYRLRGASDLHVLDIPKVLETSVCLIEWPDRLGELQPVNRLDVHLTAVNEDERNLKLTGHGAWWAGAVEDFKDERRQSRE